MGEAPSQGHCPSLPRRRLWPGTKQQPCFVLRVTVGVSGPVFLEYSLEVRTQNLPSPSCLQPQPGRPTALLNNPGALQGPPRALPPSPWPQGVPLSNRTRQMWGAGLRKTERPKSPGQHAPSLFFLWNPIPHPVSLECHPSLGQIVSLWSRLGISRPWISRANVSLLFALVSLHLKKTIWALYYFKGCFLVWKRPHVPKSLANRKMYTCVLLL